MDGRPSLPGQEGRKKRFGSRWVRGTQSKRGGLPAGKIRRDKEHRTTEQEVANGLGGGGENFFEREIPAERVRN